MQELTENLSTALLQHEYEPDRQVGAETAVDEYDNAAVAAGSFDYASVEAEVAADMRAAAGRIHQLHQARSSRSGVNSLR